MSIRVLSILLFACLIFASCEENKLEKYEGIWEGSYSGNKEGTWKIGIDDEGISKGVFTPALENQGFSVTGSVNEDGELTLTATVFGRLAIYNAFLTETALDGNWSAEEDNFSGSWSGNKRENEEGFPYGLLLNL